MATTHLLQHHPNWHPRGCTDQGTQLCLLHHSRLFYTSWVMPQIQTVMWCDCKWVGKTEALWGHKVIVPRGPTSGCKHTLSSCCKLGPIWVNVHWKYGLSCREQETHWIVSQWAEGSHANRSTTLQVGKRHFPSRSSDYKKYSWIGESKAMWRKEQLLV